MSPTPSVGLTRRLRDALGCTPRSDSEREECSPSAIIVPSDDWVPAKFKQVNHQGLRTIYLWARRMLLLAMKPEAKSLWH